MNEIWFICKAGKDAGIGHFSRCVHVAEYLKDLGVKSKILVLYDEPIVLPESYDKVDIQFLSNEELSGFCLKNRMPDGIVFDLGKVAREILLKFNALRIPIISLSPIFEYNNEIDYYIGRVPPIGKSLDSSQMLVDPGCVVINSKIPRLSQKEFKLNISRKLPRISVVLGGGRPRSKYYDVINAIKDQSGQFIIVIYVGAIGGCSKQDIESICHDLRLNHFQVLEFRSSDSMWSDISKGSVVLCEGGLIAWEAAYCGLPFISIVEKDFQVTSLNFFQQHRCGVILDMRATIFHQLTNTLHKMVSNPEGLVDHQKRILDLGLQNGGSTVARQINNLIRRRKASRQQKKEELACRN